MNLVNHRVRICDRNLKGETEGAEQIKGRLNFALFEIRHGEELLPMLLQISPISTSTKGAACF